MTDTRTTDQVSPLDAPAGFTPNEARCWAIGYNEAVAALRAADETPALPTAAETACWHGPGFVCPLCHPVLSVMPDSAADTSTAAP
jgi:hypothetical protein